jgi:sulfate transport system ATP-binding protein
VALARALAVKPRVLLLDEPFGALDAKVRKELRTWLRRLHDELHVTSLFVTHDQDEALEVADKVVVMNKGRIEQIGSPEEVFHNPRTEFVMRFLGETNDFHARVDKGTVSFGSLRMPYMEDRRQIVGDAKVFVRPHDLTIDTKANNLPGLRASVSRIQSAGPVVRLEVKTDDGQSLSVELSQERFATMNLAVGGVVYVRPRHIRVFAGGEAS